MSALLFEFSNDPSHTEIDVVQKTKGWRDSSSIDKLHDHTVSFELPYRVGLRLNAKLRSTEKKVPKTGERLTPTFSFFRAGTYVNKAYRRVARMSFSMTMNWMTIKYAHQPTVTQFLFW